jgi:phage shock protein E
MKVPPTPAQIPLTEADVPRISVAEAKAALDSGDALILDVRSAEAYAQAHITGSLNLPLTIIEADPAHLDLKKDRWLITYCT